MVKKDSFLKKKSKLDELCWVARTCAAAISISFTIFAQKRVGAAYLQTPIG